LWVAAKATTPNHLITRALLERGLNAKLVEPTSLSRQVRGGDVVLGRLDVRATLDGVEDGIWDLLHVEKRGIRVLNRGATLVSCHDKLQTALRLGRLGLPQPVTAHIDWEASLPRLEFPIVVKPRSAAGARTSSCANRVGAQALPTEAPLAPLVPPPGVLVRPSFRRSASTSESSLPAGTRRAIERVAAGEWRTNIALGAKRRAVDPPPEARQLALAAAAAVGDADLVGVDLLPLPGGGYSVLELNGAVDFTAEYSLDGTDVFRAVASMIEEAAAGTILATARSG
jgi:glutathione synthase/RimK-type ligase-like ATP-grasp enzyme